MRISDWSSDVCSSDLARRVRQRGKPVFEGRQVLKDRELIPVERRAADDKGVESPRPRQQRVRGEQAAERMAEQDMLGPVRLRIARSEEHTSELQSLMRISYAVFCLKKKTVTLCSK